MKPLEDCLKNFQMILKSVRKYDDVVEIYKTISQICHKRDCLGGFNPSLAMFVPFVGSGFVLMSELMVFSNMI